MFYTEAALRWLERILEERYGHEFSLLEQSSALLMRLPGLEGYIKFDQLQSVFQQSRSDFPCEQWSASSEKFIAPVEDRIPAPSEIKLDDPLIEMDEQGAIVHYDILGLTYWMLTRLEEVGRSDLDEHLRFPATSSHAYKHEYLERPVVDEWLSILGQVISRVWPSLKLTSHEFSIKVSHDVDHPSMCAFKPWPTVIRMMAAHLIKRRDLGAFARTLLVKLGTSKRLHPKDPNNTFDWLMTVSESNDLKSAFYFICGRTVPSRDGDYELEDPAIRELLRRIHQRGHEIGLHPSYGTFRNPELLEMEWERLERVCAEEGIEQSQWGGRMHYLRWDQPKTMRAWAASGLNYDSTLGYADRPGFRCGTCHEYPAFDSADQTFLNLRIRPLIVMECTVMGTQYLNLGVGRQAHDKILLLKERSRDVGGVFTLLWHNSYFKVATLKELYLKIMDDCNFQRSKSGA